jgi:hypothetical protein
MRSLCLFGPKTFIIVLGGGTLWHLHLQWFL